MVFLTIQHLTGKKIITTRMGRAGIIRNFKEAVMRRLLSLRQAFEDGSIDPDNTYLDVDDLLELDEADAEEE